MLNEHGIGVDAEHFAAGFAAHVMGSEMRKLKRAKTKRSREHLRELRSDVNDELTTLRGHGLTRNEDRAANDIAKGL